MGFRAEHLLPVESVMGERVTTTLHIERIEYLSGDRHIYGTVTGLGEDTRAIARLPATVTVPLNPGQDHDFAVGVERVRFFAEGSGKRTEPVRLDSRHG